MFIGCKAVFFYKRPKEKNLLTQKPYDQLSQDSADLLRATTMGPPIIVSHSVPEDRSKAIG